MSAEMIVSSCYQGPMHIEADIMTALDVLAGCLAVESSACETHSVLMVNGINNISALEAIAVYLVAAIAQNIESNLKIRKALFDESEMPRELENDVVSIIGEASVDLEFKRMVRDPWVWEGVSHLLIHLSRYNSAFHPVGKILTKTSIKHDIHDHGLDVIAIYENGNLGITAGECKAYFDNPKQAISDASNKLKEVDLNKRDPEIRATVNQLLSSLSEDERAKLSGAFWRSERSYFPLVCCDSESALNWMRNRVSTRRLSVPVSNKFLLPLSLPEARKVFDSICCAMRAYVSILEG